MCTQSDGGPADEWPAADDWDERAELIDLDAEPDEADEADDVAEADEVIDWLEGEELVDSLDLPRPAEWPLPADLPYDPRQGATLELRPERAETNTRLDKFVAARLPHLSRSYMQALIDEGRVRVDGQVRKAKFKMTPGEVVTVEIPPVVEDAPRPEPIPLDILYEDEDVIVLNKPARLVVHPAPGHAQGTLVNALLHHAPEITIAGSNRPGIVHRLDKDTSGLMVVAKTDRGRQALLAQWADRSIEKRYVALVWGALEAREGTIDAPIGREPKQRQRMAVVPRGRPAVTHFAVRERFPTSTLLNLDLETGRTHQIRVHLAFIGHPIVGDAVYGPSKRPAGLPRPPRQFLHAARLGLVLPNGQRRVFEAPLPPDLARFLNIWREAAERPPSAPARPTGRRR